MDDLGQELSFGGIYSGKRVLVTGHTGFKGSWLCTWLLQLGAQVAGFSLDVPTIPAMFEVMGLLEKITHFRGDIRDLNCLRQVIEAYKPHMVFHLAAQSLVRRSFVEPVLTIETNTLGTLNLLECLRHHPARVGVIITSDKCYLNQEWTWGYRENDTLGGDDPYSASKAAAELVFQAYYRSFYQPVSRPWMSTTRAGNVIGGGDWAPNRIVPDCMRAWSAGQSVKIRQPHATRPWQHVLEPLSGYLWLGARLWLEDNRVRGQSFNFGPAAEVNQSVAELLLALSRYWAGGRWEVEEVGSQVQRESTLLKLCCDKALNLLEWRAVLSLPEAVRFTAEWYRIYYEQGDSPMHELTCRQIESYTHQAAAKGLQWTA
jgi:CDP-glucose 4,6-dehydratase